MNCCFIGHRKICVNDDLINHLKELILKLIKIGVNNFIFGNNSEFDNLCYQIVYEYKKIYDIKLINYCCGKEIRKFDEIKIPANTRNAGKYIYIERNKAMIDDSDIIIFYYSKSYLPTSQTKSGTDIAYSYAQKCKKKIINLCQID